MRVGGGYDLRMLWPTTTAAHKSRAPKTRRGGPPVSGICLLEVEPGMTSSASFTSPDVYWSSVGAASPPLQPVMPVEDTTAQSPSVSNDLWLVGNVAWSPTKSPASCSILGRPFWSKITMPFFPSVKVACVPSPSSRVIDAPNETVQPVAATWTTSGGSFELLVSTSVAAVPGGIPPSCAPMGSTKKTIAKHNSAKAAPDRETAHPIPVLLRHTNDERYCAR